MMQCVQQYCVGLDEQCCIDGVVDYYWFGYQFLQCYMVYLQCDSEEYQQLCYVQWIENWQVEQWCGIVVVGGVCQVL